MVASTCYVDGSFSRSITESKHCSTHGCHEKATSALVAEAARKSEVGVWDPQKPQCPNTDMHERIKNGITMCLKCSTYRAVLNGGNERRHMWLYNRFPILAW